MGELVPNSNKNNSVSVRVDLSHGIGRIVWTSDLSRAGKIRHYLYLFLALSG